MLREEERRRHNGAFCCYATNINAAEAAKYGTAGVNDFQVHPLEPISARFTITANF
jgi:hypothetical protein